MSDLSPSAEALGQALVELGGEATPGETAAAAGVSARTQANGLNRLRDAGLVTGSKVRVQLTPAGWSRFSAVSEPVKVLAVVDDALAMWSDLGLYAHRAFLELLLSAIVGRHHIGTGRPDRHLAFIAVGETGTGKSALAGVVCDVLGLDPVMHELYVPAQTPGAVIGRREPGTQRWLPAPVTGQPFVLFDEFDKADDAVRKALMPYLDGRVLVQYEGEPHQLAPTPMLAANPPRQGGRLAHVRDEFRRRAVVLDTGYAAHRGADLERALTEFYATPPQRPRLDLDRLRPPTELAAPAREVLSSLRHALTAEGQAGRPPLQALEAVTLGRVALLGESNDAAQALAAFAVGVAYLQVTEQLPGQVVENWQADMAAFRSMLNGAGPAVLNLAEQLEASIDAARRARADAHARVRQSRVVRESEDLELVGARNRLAEQLRQAIDGIDGRRLSDPTDKQTAAALRAQLRAKRTEIVNTKSSTRLDDLAQLVAAPLAEAAALQARVARAADEARRDRQQQQAAIQADRRAAQQNREMTKAAARHRAQHLIAQLADARDLIRELEQLYRRHGPCDRPPFEELEARALLRYTAAAAEPREAGFLDRWAARLSPPGWWSAIHNEAAVWPGSRLRCEALAEWGDNTKAVIWPALQKAHAIEASLALQLGRQPRRRTALPAPAARLSGRTAMPHAALPRGRS